MALGLDFRPPESLQRIGEAMGEVGVAMCPKPVPVGLEPVFLGYATWADEDFIGKVSRTARSTHPLTQTLRTLEKCLGQYAQQYALLNF